MFGLKITEIVHRFMAPYIEDGDCVADLTAGNGLDTCYLAERVGNRGKVYAFDIQKKALEETQSLLQSMNLLSQVCLIHDSHEMVRAHIHHPIAAAMMNLGYLPNGDKTTITLPETTVAAIEGTLSLLKKDGVLSVVSYYGHPGGQEEKNALEVLLKNLPPKLYEVFGLHYPNRSNQAPVIFMVQKRF